MRTLDGELRAQEEHAKYLGWIQSSKKEGPQPPPTYKDCQNCEFRCEYDEEDRAEFCQESCPWDDLPPRPSTRFLLVELWASLPERFLETHADKIGLRMCMDVQKLKDYREAKKMEAMMGVNLFG